MWFFCFENKKMGLVDRTGELKIPTLYDDLEFIYTDEYMIATLDGKKGVVSCNTAKILVPILYDDVISSYPNFRTKCDNKYGFYVRDEADKEKFDEIITPKYESITGDGRSNNPWLKVRQNNKFGCLNFQGEVFIPTQYDDIRTIDDIHLKVKEGEKWGMIDTANNRIVPIEYDDLLDYKYGMAIVVQNGKYGAISTSGKKGAEFLYDELVLVDGVMRATLNGKHGCLDFNGKVLVKIEYDDIVLSEEGYATVRMGDKYGMFDKLGKKILGVTYDNIEGFNNGLAPITVNGKYGFVNGSGRIAISPQYDHIMQVDFCFFVMKNEKWGIVHAPKEKEIAKTSYDEITLTSDDIFIIKKGGLEGCLDSIGNLLFPTKYANIGQTEKADTYFAIYPTNEKVYLNLKSKKEVPIADEGLPSSQE